MTQIKIKVANSPSGVHVEVASGVLDRHVIAIGDDLYFSPHTVSKHALVINTDMDAALAELHPNRQYFDLRDPQTGKIIDHHVCWLCVRPVLGEEYLSNYFGFPSRFPANSNIKVELVAN